jgi:hypothetical protein
MLDVMRAAASKAAQQAAEEAFAAIERGHHRLTGEITRQRAWQIPQ